MEQTDAAEAYRIASFESAPPIKILRMLYEGAIRFLKRAQGLDPGDDDYRKLIRRAEEIVGELRASLDHECDADSDVSENLENLYVFVQFQLGRALLEGEVACIEVAIEILTTLLDGWKQAQIQLAAEVGGDRDVA